MGKINNNIMNCRECHSLKMVESKTTGTSYCESCGLENNASMIDFNAEWRTFTENNKNHTSSERACIYNKFSTSETGFFTTISTADASINRFNPTSETNIKSRRFSKDIESLCNELNLNNQRIKNRACEISSEMTANWLQKSMRLL